MKKILMRFFAFVLIFNLVFCFSSSCIYSYASSVDPNKVVSKHGATFGVIGFDYYNQASYFKLVDATGVPTSTTLAPNYFFSCDDGQTFDYVDGADVVMLIFNRGIGLITSPEKVGALISGFLASIAGSTFSDGTNVFIQGALYDNEHNFLGYCLDDISGRYYKHLSNQELTVPSTQCDNVYNYFNYYITNYPDDVDYITYYPPSATSVFSNYAQRNSTNNQSTGSSINFTSLNNLMSFCTSHDYTYGYVEYYSYEGGTYRCYSNFSSPTFESVYFFDNVYAVASTLTSFCNNNNLVTGDSLYYSKLINISDSLYFSFYNSSDNTSVNSYNYYNGYTDQTGVNSSGGDNFLCDYFVYCGKPFTIFRNSTVLNQINNNLYAPTYLSSTTYNDYSVNNDNSFNTNTTQISNSSTSNTVVYNEALQNFIDNSDNSYVDNSTIIINNNTIINNYYDDNSGGGDDPDDPVDPDDPDSILDALLAAILKFFQALSKIIATVFTGIVEGLTIVVEAAGSIIESIPNLTELFSSLLGWLPSPIPEVLGLGISICIIAAVFKFIRG